ncbi:MAG: efflux RND transporter periplasmic adaptor subunit [Candidatus Aminicenantaceae bacterium]
MFDFKHIYRLRVWGVLLVTTALLLAACTGTGDTAGETEEAGAEQSAEQEILYYTCGMHPSVKVSMEDYEAGNDKCPICNMDLVPVYKEGDASSTADEQGGQGMPAPEIKLSSRARALAQVETGEIGFHQLFKDIETVGQMVWDERRLAYVAAWVPGRLDRLYVNFTGSVVEKGGPLADIYSPLLLTTQEEFLLALETRDRLSQGPDQEAVEHAGSLVEAARKRMLLWGISGGQIQELEESRSASTHMTIHAPIGGTVIHKNAVEGKYVKEGENLFQIADLSRLWMEAEIYEHDLAHVIVGQHVEISSQAFPGETFHGEVAFIEPVVDPRTRSVKARVDVPNPQRRLKPGMYTNAVISVHVHEGMAAPDKDVWICTMCPEVQEDEPGECPECGMDLVKKPASAAGAVLAVPREAVLDTGARKLVYVEHEPGSYMVHEVILGPEAVAVVDGRRMRFYAVKAGLEGGMRVVVRANFLIDSQSQITGQAAAIYSGALEKGEEDKPPSKHIH